MSRTKAYEVEANSSSITAVMGVWVTRRLCTRCSTPSSTTRNWSAFRPGTNWWVLSRSTLTLRFTIGTSTRMEKIWPSGFFTFSSAGAGGTTSAGSFFFGTSIGTSVCGPESSVVGGVAGGVGFCCDQDLTGARRSSVAAKAKSVRFIMFRGNSCIASCSMLDEVRPGGDYEGAPGATGNWLSGVPLNRIWTHNGPLGGASGPLLSNGASYQGLRPVGGRTRPEAPTDYRTICFFCIQPVEKKSTL